MSAPETLSTNESNAVPHVSRPRGTRERRLRIAPIPFEALPAHPELEISPSSNRPHLSEFICDIVSEAFSVTSRIESGWHKKTEKKNKATGRIPTSIYEANRANADDRQWPLEYEDSSYAKTKSEPWFARSSYHKDSAESGSASWDEFVRGLKENHNKNETEYIGGLLWANKVMEWNGFQEVIARNPKLSKVDMCSMLFPDSIAKFSGRTSRSWQVETAHKAETDWKSASLRDVLFDSWLSNTV
jgi:Protein of unknown function (DUF3074)